MTDLAEFLLARIAEDEIRARQATPGKWKLWGMIVQADQDGTGDAATGVEVAETYSDPPRTFNANHIAHWDPLRVLAECTAKRETVEIIQRMERREAKDHSEMGRAARLDRHKLLRLLALPYADHPDCRPEWTP